MLIVGTLFATGMYFIKRDSVDGRLLIWKITTQAIADSPWGVEGGKTFLPSTVMSRKDTSQIVNIQIRRHG